MRPLKFLLVMAIASAASFAQSEKPKDPNAPVPYVTTIEKKFYRLDLTLKELDGTRIINSREFSMSLGRPGGPTSLRTGSKVPFGPENARTYMDLGVNFDCRDIQLTPTGLSMFLSAEVTGVVESDLKNATVGYPVLRTNRWSSEIAVPFGKPTVVFSSDDLSSKTRMQVEILVNPAK